MISYFVYLIKTRNKINNRFLTYVGYTNNLSRRIKLHNQGHGAKFTRGKQWKLIYYDEYKTKSEALKEEYKLKKNKKLRNFIKNSQNIEINFD